MWLWCSRCKRCFRATKRRRDAHSLSLCLHEDCSRSWFKAWPWQQLRRLDPALPKYPEPYVLYPQSARDDEQVPSTIRSS